MKSAIVQLSFQKLNTLYIYTMLGAIVAQWVLVPSGVAIYRYLLARKMTVRD